MSLPIYTVRTSPRAKNVRLKVTVRDGLEVIIPHDFDQEKLPSLLKRKETWIRQAMEKAETSRKFFEPEPPATLPEHIYLRAVDERWHVQYRDSKTRHIGAYEQGTHQLTVRGNIDDTEGCKAALQRWAARKAHDYLVPWLQVISERTDLPFKGVLVKNQRTRWASCSHKHTVSLNRKLLFLPPTLVRYVFIHELCHTIHHNHSRNFWNLLRVKEPGFEALDAELRSAWRYIPVWL